jgi:hypothetical protein
MRALLLLLCSSTGLFVGTSRATDSVLRGTVRDSASGTPVPAAIVRLLGTTRGTIANAEGEYLLELPSGTHRIVVSSVGYRSDTLGLTISLAARVDVRLAPVPIILPEVVVTSEDPAVGIMRRVIERKRRWEERLGTYEFRAFTRQTIRRDTGIAAIVESFTRGYWQKGDTLREIVQQKRQTANIPAAQNFASVGRLLNFYDDRIRFVGFAFVGPAATDAFDHYDFTLLRTYGTSGGEIADIAVEPRTRTTPLFRGSLSVALEVDALAAIDVEPNEAFVIPFVKERRLRYRQQFVEAEREFWLPADIRIDGGFTIGVLGISIPRFGFEQTSVISDYIVNGPLPDSIFQKPRLTADTAAARYDTTFWQSAAVLPLDPEQRQAYGTLDSTKTLDVQFRPGGITATLGGDGGAAGSVLEYLDAGFNRVEGFRLGVRGEREILSWLTLTGRLSYAFSEQKGKYRVGAALSPWSSGIVSFGGEAYREAAHRPDGGYFSPLYNSLTALLVKNDYWDYYGATGWRASVDLTPSRMLKGSLSFRAEDQASEPGRTDFSLFYPSQPYRTNPPIADGRLRALGLDLRLGPEPVFLDLVTTNSLEISVEHSAPSLASSDFDYTRVFALGTLVVPTAGEGFLLRPAFRFRASVGASRGELPVQRWFDVDVRSSGYAPFGVMHAAGVKEFAGTGMVAFSAEHNFRSLPFLALGLPFLYEPGIEFLLHAAGARTWQQGDGVPNTTPGWFAEAGFGIGRLFDLFRLDVTWRLAGGSMCVLSFGVASIL